MNQIKYKIHRLSARAVMGYAKETGNGWYVFDLNSAATEKCKASALSEQDDNALFYQIMDELHSGNFKINADTTVVDELSEILFYMDFAGIFDRSGRQKKYMDRQKKAESMFRPEGVTLDFGSGPHRYLAFERSASMSRRAMLSFIREDFYEPIRKRIMMDLTVGQCQLSKLYAYNGLLMSSGIRVDGIGIDRPHRVIVVDNPIFSGLPTKIITVEDDGSDSNMRKFRRVEKRIDSFEIVGFDGEGLISKQYSEVLNRALGPKRKHTSFQIRMPYVKGMLHQVDFKDFYKSAGTGTITDIWDVKHSVEDVDIILTKSMFKGAGWLKENGKSWEDYWAVFRKYHHALYITNVSKPKPEAQTELNFQFLNTLSMSAGEFRPEDLPLGWSRSPAEDDRDWLTKETELAYYNLCADENYRVTYFTNHAVGWWRPQSKESQMAKILKRNPLFISELPYVKQLESEAEGILSRYSKGKLIVAGDNRFLSGDLLSLLVSLLDTKVPRDRRQSEFHIAAMANLFPDSSFYAPGAVYDADDTCTILRNPHIARNEEIQLRPHTGKDNMRKFYLGHLTDVIMVDTHMMAAERLGGADYDGDMVKTIASPIVNQCVRKNYDAFSDSRENRDNIPLLMIPSIDPLIRDANDWQARFETVKNTFSSRVGQISNAALNRSIIAYNENSTAEERERYRQEVETLAILTGLEIDSAKSGVKPDLSEYLGAKHIKRSRFLRYKDITDSAEEQRKWYEPTPAERLKAYYEKTDWSKVDSNLEKLPYLAYQLERHTPKIKPRKNKPSDLYTFAELGWEKKLDSLILSAVTALAQDYKHCLRRIRASRQPIKERARQSDIAKILFARCQEDDYDTDTLYALFSALSQEQVTELYRAIRENNWHLMPEENREAFLRLYLPEDFSDYFDLLTDFRCSGYRILGDLVCDCMDAYRVEEQKKLHSEQDSPTMTAMLDAYLNKAGSVDYKSAVAQECRKQLETIVKAGDAVKYAVAIKDKYFLWDILYDKIYDHVKRMEVSRDAE